MRDMWRSFDCLDGPSEFLRRQTEGCSIRAFPEFRYDSKCLCPMSLWVLPAFRRHPSTTEFWKQSRYGNVYNWSQVNGQSWHKCDQLAETDSREFKLSALCLDVTNENWLNSVVDAREKWLQEDYPGRKMLIKVKKAMREKVFGWSPAQRGHAGDEKRKRWLFWYRQE